MAALVLGDMHGRDRPRISVVSSQLPKSLRQSIKDAARAPDGLVRCAMCGSGFPDDMIQIDHVKPESLGGSHDPSNLQPLCCPRKGEGCHQIKTTKEARARAARLRRDRRGQWRAYAAVWCVLLGVAFIASSLGATFQGIIRALAAILTGVILGTLIVVAGARLFNVIRARRAAAPAAEVVEDDRALAPRVRTALVPLLGDAIEVGAKRVGYVEHVKVRYPDAFADHDEGKRYEIIERVNAKMGGRWRAEWDQPRNVVTFSPAPSFPSMVRHPGLSSDHPWHLIPIADGVSIDLRVTSHSLIIGATNAGKTAVMRSIALAAIHASHEHGVEIILADPKRMELVGFEGLPGVRHVLTEDEELWEMPIRLYAEMNKRTRDVRDRKVSLTDLPPIIVEIDEYKEYVTRMMDFWNRIDPETGKPRKKAGERLPEPMRCVASLIALGRRLKIHVFIGTQRPDAAWFGGDVRDNVQFRACVGPGSVDMLRMAFGRSDVGRDLPTTAKGRFTYQDGDREISEAQAYWVPDPADFDHVNSDEDWQHLERLGLVRVE